MSSLTIRDIARMAGVSTTAVSFVLNNRSGVSDATRAKVQEIIDRTGFTPNVHTRRLNLGKSYTVQVVLRHYDHHLFNQFAMETLNSIFSVCKSLGYSVALTFTDNALDCAQIIDSVRNKDCDGIILNQIADLSIISQLQQENVPFVCVDAHIPTELNIPMVGLDYYDAAYQATRYLAEQGHTKIGFIGPTAPDVYYHNTFGGYAAALKDANLTCDPAWLAEVAYAEESAEECIHKLLQLPELPTAFLCAGDVFAVNIIRYAKTRGIRIPEDISIMSLDDLLVSRYLDPPLSTMTFNKELLGEKAMRLLYQIIQGENFEPINLIKTTPVARGTVKKLK